MPSIFSPEQRADYERDGFVMVRNLFVADEMDPGDALFFHSNVMHRSDANRSERRRWTVLFCYNAASNDPYLEHHHPRYTPLLKVSDEAMREAGLRFSAQGDDVFRKAFANPPELKRRIETSTEGPL